MYLSTVCNPARVATFNFESLFGSLFDQANHRSFGFKPRMNIRETEEQYEISMALPGFSKKDVLVEVKDAELVVRHEAQESGDNGDDHRYAHSFNVSSFERRFYIPEDTSAEKISAEMKNGVLIIVLKREKPEEVLSKKITIK